MNILNNAERYIMLFSMMIWLAVASALVELIFAAKVPVWRKNAYRFKWFNMLISIVLSFILGLMFGATGLITLGAAIISTALSVPGYSFLHWNYDSPQAQRHGGDMLKHLRKKWLQAFKDLAKLVYAVIRFITFPIWVTRWFVLHLRK
jgi:glucan phosphoethanolaminetransferase (alkaline phosphatase superfamily)